MNIETALEYYGTDDYLNSEPSWLGKAGEALLMSPDGLSKALGWAYLTEGARFICADAEGLPRGEYWPEDWLAAEGDALEWLERELYRKNLAL